MLFSKLVKNHIETKKKKPNFQINHILKDKTEKYEIKKKEINQMI